MLCFSKKDRQRFVSLKSLMTKTGLENCSPYPGITESSPVDGRVPHVPGPRHYCQGLLSRNKRFPFPAPGCSTFPSPSGKERKEKEGDGVGTVG